MQPTTEPKPATQPAAPAVPIMDVARPKPSEPTPAAALVAAPISAPVADAPAPSEPAELAKPPAEPGDDPEQLINNEASSQPEKDTKAKDEAPKSAKKPKAPSNGAGIVIGLAILAMLVLAGLAIFAYSQSK